MELGGMEIGGGWSWEGMQLGGDGAGRGWSREGMQLCGVLERCLNRSCQHSCQGCGVGVFKAILSHIRHASRDLQPIKVDRLTRDVDNASRILPIEHCLPGSLCTDGDVFVDLKNICVTASVRAVRQ